MFVSQQGAINGSTNFSNVCSGLTVNDLQNLQTLKLLQQQQQQNMQQQQLQQLQQLQLQQSCKLLAQQLVHQTSSPAINNGNGFISMQQQQHQQQQQNNQQQNQQHQLSAANVANGNLTGWPNAAGMPALTSSLATVSKNASFDNSTGSNSASELNLDRMASFHRTSAAVSDTTSTWSGILPQRVLHTKVINYSNKVFLGGIPPDITDGMFVDIFRAFGPIR